MLSFLWSACTSSPDPLACAPIEGIEPLLAENRVVLVGEMHGTAEVPRFTGEIACHALSKGKPVLLALEMPSSDNELLKAFVADGDTKALLASPFWSEAQRDGRNSWAMGDLIGRAQAMHAAGKPIEVVGFDVDSIGEGRADARDKGMADQLKAAMEAHPDAFVVVLAGNLHARRQDGMPWDPSYRPLGAWIEGTGITAVLARAMNGEAWNCQSDACTTHAFGDPAAPLVAPAIHKLATRTEGYDAEVEFGRFSASPPAVPEGK